jgi:hypothetical protein
MSTFAVDPDVVAKRVGDSVALVQLRTNQIYTLNGTGSRVWELLAEGLDREAVERRLLDEFEVEPEELASEIDQAIAILLANQLIVRPDGRR